MTIAMRPAPGAWPRASTLATPHAWLRSSLPSSAGPPPGSVAIRLRARARARAHTHTRAHAHTHAHTCSHVCSLLLPCLAFCPTCALDSCCASRVPSLLIPPERNELPETASRSRAAFSCNEPTGRLVELIKARALNYGTFSEASPAGFYSRSPAAHHWSPRRCGVPPNLTESSSPSRVQTTPSVNKWSAASRRSALVRRARRQTCSWTRPPCRRRAP